MSKVVAVRADAGARRLILVARSGAETEVDVRPFIARGGALARLDDDTVFSAARLVDHCAAVGWPGDVEIAVATLLAAAAVKSAAAE